MMNETHTLYRADLHVHSSFSNKSSVWAMKKINCPESYTPPEFIYREARKKGMDYATITDHNTIEGGLRIAHLPGTFLSCEITSYFPENGCKIHVIALDVAESQFRTIMELRKNVYEMTAYFRQQGILHLIAHPLYDMGGKLTVEIVERMLLLFEAIEIKNGAHGQNLNTVIRDVVSALTPEKIEELANKHNLEPSGSEPWRKICLGGSDDHSGFFIARAHTVSPEGATAGEFLKGLRNRNSMVEGEDGDALTLAHSIYGVAYRFYQEHIGPKKKHFPFVDLLLNNYFRAEPGKQTLSKRIQFFVRKNMPEMYDRYDGKSFETILDREVKKLLNDRQFLDRLSGEGKNRKIFSVTSYLANRMIYIYTNKLLRKPLGNGLFEVFRSLSTIGLVHFFIAPYYIAYFNQNSDKDLLKTIESRLVGGRSAEQKKQKIALFTDTLDEINGVAKTMKRLAGAAEERGVDLTLVTCSQKEPSFTHRVKHFESIGDFLLKDGEELSTLYASSDLFVFPSTTDTFGNVVLEAQASGLPVIVSDEGGPKELMKHGETGFVVKSNDKTELVLALKYLIGNRAKIHAMGQSARRFIEKRAVRSDEAYSTIFTQRQF